MNPQTAIADLDFALLDVGENVTLRRIVGTGPSPTNYDIAIRAHVRSFKESELVPGVITQDHRLLIMSPTEITGANWPNGSFSLPKTGDKFIVSGTICNAAFVKPIRMAGQVVRIEARIVG